MALASSINIMDSMEHDGDPEIEAKLLQQFSSMATTDKEVLISDFQTLLGNQLNPATCAFFLDMNNWNLQLAIGSYLDFEQPLPTPAMSCANDITIGEGEAVPPNTIFLKTWRIKNHGTERWPPGCSLKFIKGDRLTSEDCVLVDSLDPQQSMDLSIKCESPAVAGTYKAQWRMSTATGIHFGDVIWVLVTVAEGAMMGVTQQMSNLISSGQSDDAQDMCPLVVSKLASSTAGCLDTPPASSMSMMYTNSDTLHTPARDTTLQNVTQISSVLTEQQPASQSIHTTDSDDVDMMT